MAMDNFKEEIVIKRHNAVANIAYYVVWFMIVVFTFIGVINFSQILNPETGFNWVSLVTAVVFLGLAALLYFKKDSLRVEYEYTFTNGVLDVSRVMNNSKRRYLTELPMKIVESCGSVTHPSFNRYLNDKAIKKHNWFLNRDNDLVYFFFTKNNVKHLVVIEPSAEMQEMIRSRNYLGFGVWQK